MKKMIFEQIKRSLEKDTTSTIFLFSLFILSITLMIFSISFCYETNNKQNKVEKIYQKNYYKMYDNYVGQEEEIFMNEPDNVVRLKKFYNELCNSTEFSYFTIINQSVYIQNVNLPEQFYYNYEYSQQKQIVDINDENKNYHCLKALQINKSVINEFKLNVNSIDKEAIDDWDTINISENTIPVMLGANYKGHFDINKTYKMFYLSKFFNIKIIGFLEKNDNIYYNGDMLYLDDYIVFPSLNIEELPLDENEKKLQLAMYLQKCSGVISSELNAQDIQIKVNEIASKYDLKAYSIKEAQMSNIQIFNLEAKEFSILLLVISSIIVCFSAIGLSLTLSSKIEDELSTYAVHLLVGASLNDIKKYILGEISFIICISIIIAIILAELLNNFRIYCLPISIIVSVIVGVFSYIYPSKVIKKINLNEILKRND